MNRKSYTNACERIVKNPLPFYYRIRVHLFIFLLGMWFQFYTCKQCAEWRRNFNKHKKITMDTNDTKLTNLTKSFANFNSGNTTFDILTSFIHGDLMNNSASFSDKIMANNESSNMTANNETSFHLYPVSTDIKNETNFPRHKIISTIPINATPFIDTTATNSNTVMLEEYCPPLYAHTFLPFFIMLCFHILAFVLRSKFEQMFGYSVAYLNWVVPSDVQLCASTRSIYVPHDRQLSKPEESILKTALTLKEQSSFFRLWHTACLWNPREHFFSLNYPSIDCRLSDYMFLNHSDDCFQILGAIALIHDVMKALEYLHYRNNYHLNLTSENVKLHCNGMKVYVKLSNFDFMKRAAEKKVSSESVGLKGFYRPPECCDGQEVDAEKCDVWGLGMIALDLFTGGMYRIETETFRCDILKKDSHIQQFVHQRHFFSYVLGTYRVISMFNKARFWSKSAPEIWVNPAEKGDVQICLRLEYPYKTYPVDHLFFLYDLRCFVYKMLILNPVRRITLEKAFKEPFIAKRGSHF